MPPNESWTTLLSAAKNMWAFLKVTNLDTSNQTGRIAIFWLNGCRLLIHYKMRKMFWFIENHMRTSDIFMNRSKTTQTTIQYMHLLQIPVAVFLKFKSTVYTNGNIHACTGMWFFPIDVEYFRDHLCFRRVSLNSCKNLKSLLVYSYSFFLFFVFY